jgi:hypothetical protein
MPLFAVSLLFSLEVQAADAPKPLYELAVHVVFAADEDEALSRGRVIGRQREDSYRNREGELVRNVFKSVVSVHGLFEDDFSDGIEVAYWMFRGGECIVIDEQGVAVRPAVGRREEGNA